MSEKTLDSYVIVSNKRAKADAWMHFGFKKDKNTNEIDKSVAICKLCNAEVKCAGGTTNLSHHMRRKHPSIPLTKGPVPIKKQKLNTDTDGNNNSEGTQVVERTPFQQKLVMGTGSLKYAPKSPKALAITDKIGRFIIKDL